MKSRLRNIFMLIMAATAMAIFIPAGTVLAAVSSPTLIFMTEESPPDNFTENGKLKGVAVEMLHKLWDTLGEKKKPVQLLPWARAYREIQNTPGTVLFSMTRTPEREKLFKWVGPIRPSRYVLVAPRSLGITRISSKDALKNYRIGTVIDDVCEKLLEGHGVQLDQLDRSQSSPQNLTKFREGRFDLLPFSETGVVTALRAQGMDPSKYRIVYLLSEEEIYFAFHHDTPDPVVRRYQKAIDTLHSSGYAEKIYRRYDIIPLNSARK